MSEPDARGRPGLRTGSSRGRNIFGLPDGPWFLWSREFRWDLMPWNRKMRRSVRQHRRHQELLHLVEATAGTVGLVARQLGFDFHSASTGQRNSDVEHTVLYEAAPGGLADRYPKLAGPDAPCVDLWVHWEPESGRLEVHPPGAHGLRALETLERGRLVEITTQPVVDVDELRVALDGWGEGLRAWLEEGQTP